MELEQLNSLHRCWLDNVALEQQQAMVMSADIQSQTEGSMLFQASLLNEIFQAVIATDIEGKITYWNRYATLLYQWQAAEVIGQIIYEVIVPANNYQQAQEIFARIAHLGSWKGELLVQRKDGTQFWVETTYAALKDAHNNLTGLVGISDNTTERQHLEESQSPNEANNRILFEAIPDAIFRMRKDGTFLESKIAKNFDSHLQIGECSGKQITKTLSLEVAELAMQQIARSLATGNLQIFEYQLLKAGQQHGFEARIVPIGNEEVLMIVRDITEQKQAEAHLTKNEERYRIVTELVSDYVYTARIDTSGNLVTDWITGAFSRICGFTCEEIEARGGWQTLIHPDDRPIFLKHVQTLLHWQSDVSEYRIFTKDRESRWLRDYSQPVECDDENHLLLIYGAAQDITERKQAEEALRQQTERERLLGMIYERIRQSLNIDEILEQAVAEVRSFLQVERVTIYQIAPNNFNKFVVESVAPGCASLLGLSCHDHCFQAEYTQKYTQGQVSAIDDIYKANFAPCHLDLLAQLEIRANLIVPIVFNNQLWGLLCAHQCSAPRHWQPFEIDSLEQLATKIAIAIQQSELYQQIQTLNTDLEQQVQERTAQLRQALEFEAMLKRITEKVRDSLDENQILETAVREVAVGLGMSSCNAALYDLEKGIAVICYEYAVSIPATYGRVAQITNFPEIYNQLLKKQHFQFCSLLPNPAQGRRARLACPIFDNEGVIGDLWLVNHHDYAFSDLEIRLVQQVANHCAIAIRQARLYQQSRARVEELDKLNRLKDDFLSTVSHELRTPMSNIKMAIQMLKVATTNERRQRYLEILQAECNRETDLINDLLDLQRLEAESYPLFLEEAINLQEWLPEIAEPFYSRAHDHQQTLQLEAPSNLPPLISNHNGLGRIIAELLNNACKYTPAGGAIILRVSHQVREEREEKREGLDINTFQLSPAATIMVFTVSNQAEIPAKELPHLFEKFYRVPKADLWQQGGTGLGLALVQKLVEQMAGTIYVESKDGWTTFRVEFPTHP